jgi:tetratricopeptide (TPR) repeat protein
MDHFKEFCASIFIVSVLLLSGLAYGASGLAHGDSAKNHADSIARNPDFIEGRNSMVSGDWEGAANAFRRAARRWPGNADIQNLIGFSYAQMNEMDLAIQHYKLALRFNPRHLDANQYIAWSYLKMGVMDKAEEHLARLKEICGTECDQYTRLKLGVASYKNRSASITIANETM